jgi:hypothetical protein
MTLYQNTALEISQLVEVPNGIYKATIQNTYRSSKRETLTKYSTDNGISICNAYFAANEIRQRLLSGLRFALLQRCHTLVEILKISLPIPSTPQRCGHL